jgi:hypothetical protein
MLGFLLDPNKELVGAISPELCRKPASRASSATAELPNAIVRQSKASGPVTVYVEKGPLWVTPRMTHNWRLPAPHGPVHLIGC